MNPYQHQKGHLTMITHHNLAPEFTHGFYLEHFRTHDIMLCPRKRSSANLPSFPNWGGVLGCGGDVITMGGQFLDFCSYGVGKIDVTSRTGVTIPIPIPILLELASETKKKDFHLDHKQN